MSLTETCVAVSHATLRTWSQMAGGVICAKQAFTISTAITHETRQCCICNQEQPVVIMFAPDVDTLAESSAQPSRKMLSTMWHIRRLIAFA